MPKPGLTKRDVLAAAAAGTLAGVLTRGARAADRPLTVVLESEVVILDPHVSTAAITRTFGYQVFDTLFSMDGKGVIHPQMVRDHEVSADQLTWRFTLRDGLVFHDGATVTAADCVASLQRWASRDSLGRMLVAALASIAAQDARTFTIALNKPFPLMLDVLGKPNAPVPFIMPARILPAAADQRIKEIVGSGPFAFRADAWRPGDSMVLTRHAGYVPRSGPPDFLAGGKVVRVPEVVLRTMPDDATAASALINNEIDYMQYLPFDWIERLDRTPNVRVMALSGFDMFQGNFRLNHASGPFADPAIRQVLWSLVDQKETLAAIGIADRFATECRSFWMCGTPLTTDAGAGVARFSAAEAKAALARTGYNKEPVVMLQVAGSISQTAANVLAQHMKTAGFVVDEQVMDWGTVLARRAKKDGWSMFALYANGVDMSSPLNHFYVGNNCSDYPGSSCSTAMTGMLSAFAGAQDAAARKAIAAQIQEEAYRLTPSVMWGQFSRPAGYRSRLKGLVQSSFPMFWEAELTA